MRGGNPNPELHPENLAQYNERAGAPKGNRNCAKGTRWRHALEAELARIGEGDISKGLAKIARTVVKLAMEGDEKAYTEIANRMDGKVPQAITGPDGDAMQVEIIRRVIVDPEKPDA